MEGQRAITTLCLKLQKSHFLSLELVYYSWSREKGREVVEDVFHLIYFTAQQPVVANDNLDVKVKDLNFALVLYIHPGCTREKWLPWIVDGWLDQNLVVMVSW
jgi:hypothetical protein